MDTRDQSEEVLQVTETSSDFPTPNLDDGLLDLIRLRLAQIHSHPHGIELHTIALLKQNESEYRLRQLPTWATSHLFNRRERFALALTEMLTAHPDSSVTRSMLQEAPRYFSRSEIIRLVLVIQAVQDWHTNQSETVLEVEAPKLTPSMSR